MSEHELELRLRSVARELDADAPAFDPALLAGVRIRNVRRLLIALAAVAALTGITVAPAAVSALGDLFDVDRVPALEGVAPDVAPPHLGRQVSQDTAQAAVPFLVRTIPTLGTPDAIYVRDDIVGGTVTTAYDGNRILLTQWPVADVHPRLTIVPAGSTAEDVTAGDLRALWIAGAARGTISVIGADGATHRELFDVADGALLWRNDGVAFLLQGAGTKAHAAELAAQVSP